eukprot:CCRYP_004014-RA/>CCRYP_004014-RA protein AED:0.44 eAED:0.58 QI:0/0/0/1/0/0/2/0/84
MSNQILMHCPKPLITSGTSHRIPLQQQQTHCLRHLQDTITFTQLSQSEAHNQANSTHKAIEDRLQCHTRKAKLAHSLYIKPPCM